MEFKNCVPSSDFKWQELSINVLLLFFQTLSIWYVFKGIYIWILIFILLSFIQYATLKLFRKFIFNDDSLCVKSFVFKRIETIDYELIKEAKYVKSNRSDGPFLELKFKSRVFSLGYHCYYKEKSNYIRVLKHLHRKGVVILFKGFDHQEHKKIENEIMRMFL